jgi:hypothetical protein
MEKILYAQSAAAQAIYEVLTALPIVCDSLPALFSNYLYLAENKARHEQILHPLRPICLRRFSHAHPPFSLRQPVRLGTREICSARAFFCGQYLLSICFNCIFSCLSPESD